MTNNSEVREVLEIIDSEFVNPIPLKGFLEISARGYAYSVTKTRPSLKNKDLENKFYQFNDLYQIPKYIVEKFESTDDLPNWLEGKVCYKFKSSQFDFSQIVFLSKCWKDADLICKNLHDAWGRTFESLTDYVYCIPVKYLKPLEFNKSELAIIEEKKKQKADNIIIQNLLRPTIEQICKKYGIQAIGISENCGFEFKDCSTLNEFVKKALEETVLKDLEEAGYKIKKLRRFGKLTISSTLFNLDDVILKDNE